VLQGRQVTVVFTGDEEDVGAPHAVSRKALFDAAAASDVALGFEGAVEGVAVVGRRGIGTWRLEVTGVQAHSSGIFSESRGHGAIFEAARILDRFRTELREPHLQPVRDRGRHQRDLRRRQQERHCTRQDQRHSARGPRDG
jgi:glutamate carboxypeptidase